MRPAGPQRLLDALVHQLLLAVDAACVHLEQHRDAVPGPPRDLRVVRAYSRRVAAGDIEALASMVTPAQDVEHAVQAAVIGLRAFGYSWTEVANRLGISRQAARQRWTGLDP
jgi:hypothetical protein